VKSYFRSRLFPMNMQRMRLLPKSINVTLPVPNGQARKRSEGSFIRRRNEILPPPPKAGDSE